MRRPSPTCETVGGVAFPSSSLVFVFPPSSPWFVPAALGPDQLSGPGPTILAIFIRLPGPSRANSGASYATRDTKCLDVIASTAVGS